jgi:peptidylprolyl isomerase
MPRACLFLLVLSILFSDPAAGQTPDQRRRDDEARRDKIESILRIQDLRTPHDGSLRGALSDRDPQVRRKAYLAYASLQDTAEISALVAGLADPDTDVQEAAAFAVGQTGMMLSDAGRQRLEDDLLWKRLDETSAKDRLIEEIGKFGTPEALRQLLLREGNAFPGPHTPALQRAIARFAIRTVTSDDGVRYLLRSIRPAERAPWEVLYALQRIGDHPEIRQDLEHLLLIREHPEPLARMNLAALLGKVKEPRLVLTTLQNLALRDSDWRVRVNALRALGSQGLRGQPVCIEIVRTSMFDAHPHVALAAISAAGSADLGGDPPEPFAVQLLDQLKLIATNSGGTFHWHTQAEAANALAGLLGPSAFGFCQPGRNAEPGLTAELLRVAGRTGAPDALALLSTYLEDESPRVVCGALDGLGALLAKHPADSGMAVAVLRSALTALESRDVAVVSTAAGMLREKPLVSHTPVAALTGKLAALRVPDDIEAFQEICATLGTLKDRAALPVLLEVLKTPDPSVAGAAADALQSITGTDYRNRIPRRTEPLYTDLDFAYLRALPDTIPATLETARGTIGLVLFKNAAPFTIMALAKLADQRGFFRGRTFHRVVSNFVIQGGDPRGDGWGGPGFTLRSEFSPLAYETGTVGIASAGKDTEGSQFFITHSPQPHLDGKYTIVGKVLRGQEVVDQILVDDRIYDFKIGRGE